MVNDDLDDMFRDDSDRKYVEVYIIHENTAPIKIHKISKFKLLSEVNILFNLLTIING